MERKSERRTLIGVSIWHFINAILTIFVFGMWFKMNGDIAMVEMYPELIGGGSSYVDILYTVMTTYGVAIILVGAINIYCLRYLKNNEINHKWQWWMGIMCLLSILSMDVIAALLYMIALVTYSAKNKAIKVHTEKFGQAPV